MVYRLEDCQGNLWVGEEGNGRRNKNIFLIRNDDDDDNVDNYNDLFR